METPFHFSFGPQWHALWPHKTIERNRKIYDFELVYFASGAARLFSDAGSCDCVPGSVVIVPPDLLHCTVSEAACERWCIHFDWFGDCRAHDGGKPLIFVYADALDDFDAACVARVPELPGIRFPFFRRHVPGAILPLLRRYFVTGVDSFPERLAKEGLLRQILALVFAEAAPRDGFFPRGRLFREAKNYIDINFRAPGLRPADVAARLHVTVNHLSREFRYAIGLSAEAYLLVRKLEYAGKLLENPQNSVCEAAFAAGFEDPNYFSRVFRKHMGCSPKEYRGAALPVSAASTISSRGE